MKNTLLTLLKLTEIDNNLDQLAEENTEIPEFIKTAQTTISSLEKQVADKQTALADTEKAKRAAEDFIKEKTQWLSDREARINEISTNKEYQSAQKEISFAKKEIRDKETFVQSLNSKIDTLTSDSKSATENNLPKIEECKKTIEERQARLTRIDSMTAELGIKRNEALKDFPDQAVLANYEQIHKRVQPAMAKADNGNCSECGTRILPQTLNLLKVGDTLFSCTRCKRIIYLEEMLLG